MISTENIKENKGKKLALTEKDEKEKCGLWGRKELKYIKF